LYDDDDPKTLEVTTRVQKQEFAQLLGCLDDLCVFSTSTIKEHASAIKTGARHNWAKWLLFPRKLRRKFKASEYDFTNLCCGAIENGDRLFVIYGVQKKSIVTQQDNE